MAPGKGLASALGGWNMLINAQTDMPDEAWEFVQFMTSEQGQRQRALSASLLPTRPALYQDQEIRDTLPVVVQGEAALKNAEVAPGLALLLGHVPWRWPSSSTGWSAATPPRRTPSRRCRTSLEQIVEAGRSLRQIPRRVPPGPTRER